MSLLHAAALAAALHTGVAAQGEETSVPDPAAVAHAFIALLARHEFVTAESAMNSRMRRVMPADRLEATWSGIEAKAGAFRAQHGVVVTQAGPYHIVAVTCEFAGASLDLRVTLDAAGLVSGLHIVPTPVPWHSASYAVPAAFRAEAVTVGHGALALPATLTMPVGNGPFPAVVLVHGSGPNDRDESIGGVKVFRDLAEGLSSRGVAVLRYEKRTRAHPESFGGAFTVNDEVVDDAVAAAAQLRASPLIDGRRVFVLGHSLGGMLAPRIGQRDSRLAGLIVLAGTTRALEDVITEQTAYLLAAAGQDSAAARPQLDALRAGADRVRSLTAADSASLQPIIGAPASYWLDLRPYRPARVAATLRVPMLILQGERDYQVTMADFAGWQAALAGTPGVTLKSYPGLNHLFVSGTGPSVPGEYAAMAHVSDEVIADVAAWITTAR